MLQIKFHEKGGKQIIKIVYIENLFTIHFKFNYFNV